MPGFVLLVRDRQDGDPAMRLGITVTKKIGGAVIRNRMKRRFRALSREILPEAGFEGADHVLIGRAGGIERDGVRCGNVHRDLLTQGLESFSRSRALQRDEHADLAAELRKALAKLRR